MDVINYDFSDLDTLIGLSLPIEMRLVAEPLELSPGETTRVEWTVRGADDVGLWHTDVMPDAPEPLNWAQVFQAGEPVPPTHDLKLTVERDTAVYVVARAGQQLRGQRLLVEIHREPDRIEDSVGCSPTDSILQKMEMTPHVAQLDEVVFDRTRIVPMPMEFPDLWSSPPAPPGISITAPQPVIFTDESATVTWSVSATNCVTVGSTMSATRLETDSGNPSGSKYDGGGWGSGSSLMCGGNNPGSHTIAGKHGPSHTVLHVHASNSTGKSAASSQWIDTLGVPKFEGSATPARQSAIRNSLRKIDTKLREGRLLYDTYLDGTVEAFKKGCLSRKGMWSRMLAELQNLHLTPIRCEDTQDPKAASASFEPYTGRIYLRWKPNSQPNLDYVLCHELTHKAGFHDGMYACGVAGYNECGADHVASAILGLKPDPCTPVGP